MIQEMLPLDIPIQGFDTFLGWSSPPSKGAIPSLESSNSVSFYRGLFEETLPAFLKQVSSEEENDDQFRPLAFANVSDLCTSSRELAFLNRTFIFFRTLLIINVSSE